MKAIQITRFGGPEVLAIAEVPKPRPGPGQVLIRVAAAGVNFAETLMREDRYVASYTLPAIPGSEVAGTIEELGESVSGLSVGQRVGAVLAASRTLTGGYAEYAVADARVTAVLPDEIGFAEATGLLVQGLTALYLTREASPKGRDVLITAAGGGVGSLLVQLARHTGAYRVIAVASNDAKRLLALTLGADEAVDYSNLSELSPSLIYESVGADIFPRCLEILAPRGVMVAYGALNLQAFALGVPELKRLVFGNQTLRGFAFGGLVQAYNLKNDLDELFELAARQVLKVTVGATYSLGEAAQAHQAMRLRNAIGKLVIVPS